ncbi:MAG: chitin deacetylase family protein [Phormidesmis sp.]
MFIFAYYRYQGLGWLWLLAGAIALCWLFLQPRWLMMLAARIWPGALYWVNWPVTSGPFGMPDKPPKVIALTIDDGPSSATADILSMLDRFGAKATFFSISGRVSGYEEVMQRSLTAGHELGNHLTADEPSIRLTPEAFETDLLAAASVFSACIEKSEVEPKPCLRWLRPGMGYYSAAMVKTAQRHGYRLVLGSLWPYDTHVPSSQFASAFILSRVKPGDIVVLHDGDRRDGDHSNIGRGQRTTATLKRILPVLHARGYTVTTVSELLSLVEPDAAAYF